MEVEKFLNMCDSASDVLLDDICPDENLVEHSGIFGMKWGNRRYQNEDGTYTEEGKKRRRKTFSNMSRSEKKAAKKALKKARDAREEKAERKEAVQRGDIRYAQMNFDKFSEDEITELYRRYDMKREIDRINTQKSQETLDKWVNRLDSAGKMARSVDSIYTSLNDMSETHKNSKAAESRRKMENKKSKLALEEQKLKNDNQRTKNKVEEENYSRMLEETKDYRDKLRKYELEQKRLSNEKLSAEEDSIRSKTRNESAKADRDAQEWKDKFRPGAVDPQSALNYVKNIKALRDNTKEAVRENIEESYPKSRFPKDSPVSYKEFVNDLVNEQMIKFDKNYPSDYKTYVNSGGAQYTTQKDEVMGAKKLSDKQLKELAKQIAEMNEED